ncbi:hypothetical protein G3601_005371 [Salmonella enterica]|uniref:CfcF n=1 Tax=Salmonella diarizonae TaxID=59204 RepID=A0A5Y1YEZ0_SALDZ|nr:hypothetical protein [Salmonella enterica]EBS3850704.1 hypothetical protein [Salmonella enterica subsp. enterica serovar Java]ECB2072186.1 hypothetical protein [Salmonella enterica subsp. enterica serovar Benin]ECC3917328.1 hypothetical protein [Salmonella enterica subsp. diarizonae]EDX3987267.1 hypothetical protein [Salmonella enterica subsp. enterica serovar 4,[5],12:b:-]EEE5613357.1 hypothetical protein [Salmonella enterica subsp. enterica serovar Typhimurium]EEE9947842.1 hypothetical p
MSRSLYNWLYRDTLSSRGRTALLFGGVVVLVAAVGGGTWYYFHAKAMEKEEQARQAAEALQQKRTNIHNFYTTALTGADVRGFLSLYTEILHSRQPVTLSGFREDSFSCTTDSCSFSYLSGENTVFSVQDKVFRGKSYAPSFSLNSVDYSGIPSGMNSNPELEAFNRQQKISEPDCNDVLNYVYSYNSLAEADRRFTLKELPASSVSADEDSLPGNPDNHGLLAGKWQVSLSDNYVSVFSFWRNQPYASSFIFQSVAGKQGILDISGTFLCKK